MHRALLLILVLLLPSPALATPWFDQLWAERLVARSFPDYWAWIVEIRKADRDRYIDLLQQGRSMAMSREAHPELVEAWEANFHALQAYRDLARTWHSGPARQTDELRLALISAAEEVHLATLDLMDAQLAVSEARTEQLQLQIEDRSLNYEAYALETVGRTTGE
ncbi:MAG: hypothetical protein ABIO70_21005 [Pseudomonadota bacterium]